MLQERDVQDLVFSHALRLLQCPMSKDQGTMSTCSLQSSQGVYTQLEVETLKTLLKQFGPDWKLIGEKLGRSAQSVKDRCRQFKDSQGCINNGKWSADEEKRLIMAVHEVGRPANGCASGSGGGGEEGSWVVSASKWRTVASLVKTRTEKQCRLKWSEVVKASISVGVGGDPVHPAASNSTSTTTREGVSRTTATAHNNRPNVETVAEWGSEEDAQLLSTLNKVMNHSLSTNDHSGFKTSRIEASDFVGAILNGSRTVHSSQAEEYSSRDAILAASSASQVSPSIVASNTAHLLPVHSIGASSVVTQDHAAAVAVAASAGLVTSAIHLPASALQQHQLQQHVMPEGSYIWTHHPL